MRIEGLNRPPAAHHGDAVGEALHVTHLVSDQNHRRPLPCKGAHGFQQTLGFLIGEYRRRLIEDQDPRASQQHLENFHPLLLGHRQRLGDLARVDGETQLCRLVADPLFQSRQPLPVAARESMITGPHWQPQLDVLSHGKGLHQLEMLVNHADVVATSIPRAAQAHRVVIDQQRSAFRCVEAGGDVHQRGFARAVLAEQRVHFAPLGGEIRLGQGHEAVERLAYPGQLDRVQVAHCWVITPLTNQSICHNAGSAMTSPAAMRSVPSRSSIGPA